jgi:hypothetical protein
MVELRDFNGKLIHIEKYKVPVTNNDFIIITTDKCSIILNKEQLQEFKNAIDKELENEI